jgi:putative endonuclease
MEPRRFVYVLESVHDAARHYIGLTSDVASRLVEHNAGNSRHTSKYRPWHPRTAIEFADSARAARFERYLKSGSGRAFAKRHFG